MKTASSSYIALHHIPGHILHFSPYQTGCFCWGYRIHGRFASFLSFTNFLGQEFTAGRKFSPNFPYLSETPSSTSRGSVPLESPRHGVAAGRYNAVAVMPRQHVACDKGPGGRRVKGSQGLVSKILVYLTRIFHLMWVTMLPFQS